MANPFAKKTAAAETPVTPKVTAKTAPAAEVAEDVNVTGPETKGKTKKPTGPRKSPNRQATENDIVYIIEHYATQSPSEIGAAIGLTRQQVYKKVLDTRKKLLEKAAASSPAEKAKIEKFVEEKLPSKIEQFGHAGGSRKKLVDTVVDDILSSIME